MSFSQPERDRFVAALQSRNWVLQDGLIRSPSGGLWFEAAHFEIWSPGEMRETFHNRAARIESAAFEDWQICADENRQVCAAVDAAEGA